MHYDNSFFKTCALFIRGDISSIKLNGRKSDVRLVTNVMTESKKQHELLHSDAQAPEVLSQITAKNKAAKRFFKATRIKWPF